MIQQLAIKCLCLLLSPPLLYILKEAHKKNGKDDCARRRRREEEKRRRGWVGGWRVQLHQEEAVVANPKASFGSLFQRPRRLLEARNRRARRSPHRSPPPIPYSSRQLVSLSLSPPDNRSATFLLLVTVWTLKIWSLFLKINFNHK